LDTAIIANCLPKVIALDQLNVAQSKTFLDTLFSNTIGYSPETRATLMTRFAKLMVDHKQVTMILAIGSGPYSAVIDNLDHVELPLAYRFGW